MALDPPNYTQVPNELLGDILKGNIIRPGLVAEMGLAELKVVLSVCRLTFGFHQDERRASLSQLQKLTGLSRQGVLDGADEAEKHGLIERVQDGGVTLWRILVKLVDQDEVVKPVDQPVKPVDQGVKQVDQRGQATRPPSKKETRNIPPKETKKETWGSAAKNLAPTRDPSFLPSAEIQASVIFANGGGSSEGEMVLRRARWNIANDDQRQAVALFLEASHLPPPRKKSQRDWLAEIDYHIQAYGLIALKELYPAIIAKMRGDGLTVSRPGSVTSMMGDFWAKKQAANGRASPVSSWLSDEDLAIADADNKRRLAEMEARA